MRTAKDVRTDPKRGDVVRKGKRMRTVIGRPQLLDPWVSFREGSGQTGRAQAITLDYWTEWAKDAEVINVA